MLNRRRIAVLCATILAAVCLAATPVLATATEDYWTGTTLEGARYEVSYTPAAEGDRSTGAFEIVLYDLAPPTPLPDIVDDLSADERVQRGIDSIDRLDLLALAVPWSDGERPILVFDHAIIEDATNGETYRLEEKSQFASSWRRFGLTGSVSSWLSVDAPHLATDLPVVAVHWSPRGKPGQRVRELHLRLDVPAPPSQPDDQLRPHSAPMRARLTRLVANPDWIDRCRMAEPLLLAYDAADWAFQESGAATSATEASRWRRFALPQEGAYHIERAWLEAAGFTGDAADPARARIFSDGAELPTVVLDDGSVAVWLAESESPTAYETIVHLEAGSDEAPLRMSPEATVASSTVEPTATIRRRVTVGDDNELIISRDQYLTIIDYAWVDASIPAGGARELEVDLPFYVESTTPVEALVRLFLSNGDRAGTVSLELAIDGSSQPRRALTSRGTFEVKYEIPRGRWSASGTKISIRDSLSAAQAAGGRQSFHFDSLELEYEAEPFVDRVPFFFALNESARDLDRSLVLDGLVTGDSPPLVLDITDPARPQIVATSTEPGSAAVSLDRLRAGRGEFVAFTELELRVPPTPELVTVDPSLRKPGAEVDQWIVYHSDFRNAVERLAEHRRSQGWRIGLADIAAIETAFGVGQLDPAVVQRFLAFQYAHAASLPGSVLLVGDATHDYDDTLKTGVLNFVPTWREGKSETSAQRYPVDLHFGRLTGDDWLVDLAVGRLSVRHVEDAEAIVDKLIAYDTTPTPGPWRARSLQVADTGLEFRVDAELMRRDDMATSLADRAAYLDQFGWIDNFLFTPEEQAARRSKISPEATTAVRSAWDEGLSAVLYWGHGSPNIWSSQRVWFGGGSDNSDNLLLSNAPHLPFVLNMTCNTGAVDYPLPPWDVCMTEDILRQRDGGGIAVVAPGGIGTPLEHRHKARALARTLARDGGTGPLSVGDVITEARWEYALHGRDDSMLRMYLLQGDPLTGLARPAAKLDVAIEDVVRAPGSVAAHNVILRGDSLPLHIRTSFASGETVRWTATVTSGRGRELVRRDGIVGHELFVVREDGAWSLLLNHLPENVDPLSDVERALALEDGARRASLYLWADTPRAESPANNVVDALGGVEWVVGEPRVSLGAISPGIVRRDPEQGDQAMLVTVEIINDGAVDASEIEVSLFRANLGSTWSGASAEFDSEPLHTESLEVPARSTRIVVFEVSPHDDEAWLLAPTLSRSPADISRLLPPGAPVAVVAGSDVIGAFPLTPTARWTRLPAESDHRTEARVEVAFFPGITQISAATLVVDGKEVGRQTMPPGEAPALRTITALIPVPEAGAIEPRLVLRDSEDSKLVETATPILSRGVGLRPDVAIVNVRAVDESPIVGSTVFLDVEVANLGELPVEDIRFDGETPSPTRTLPGQIGRRGSENRLDDRTLATSPSIDRLEPGEHATVRMRWDPESFMPLESKVTIRATPSRRPLEKVDDNNEASVVIRFRKNFELQIASSPAVTVEVLDARRRQARLATTIRNVGDAPADRVEVTFYANRDDADARGDGIGTFVLDRVAPGESRDVVLEYVVPRATLEAGFEPAVVVNVKGSRQRVSGGA